MIDYNFKNNLYSEHIFYEEPMHAFMFFTNKNHLKEFYKYLFHRIKSENTFSDRSSHVYANENDRIALLDINYNFFIEVLAEWIEYYSKNSTIKLKYAKYKHVNNSKEDEEYDKNNYDTFVKNISYEMSVKELVLFHYSHSQWLSSHLLRKINRYRLVNILFNNFNSGQTYVPNYNNYKRATPVTVALVKENNEYSRVATMSLVVKNFKPLLVATKL